MAGERFASTYPRHTYIEERTEQLHSKVEKLKFITIELREEIKRQKIDLTV